jgi:hypothetical protein
MTRRRGKGRPSELTPLALQKIVAALRNQSPLSDAAWVGGVSPRTVERWRKDGEADEVNGRDTPERKFWRETSIAIAEGRVVLAGRNFAMARFDGHLAMKILERRDPLNWTPKKDVGDATPTAPESPRKAFLARLAAIEERLAEARRAGIETTSSVDESGEKKSKH